MEKKGDRVGRGRKKNETYTRRTNGEIHRDQIRHEQEMATRRQNFFGPRTTGPVAPTQLLYPEQHSMSTEKTEKTPPTMNVDKSPLPGVDLHNIPPLLRDPIGKVVSDLRSRMKASLGESDLARNEHSIHSHLPLAQLPLTPIMVKSWSQFVDAVMPILEIIDGASEVIPIGLDIEWDSLSNVSRRESFPEIIQLAISEPQLERVIVVSVRQAFAEVIKTMDENGNENYPVNDVHKWCREHNLLHRLLTNCNAEFVGVGISGDFTRLRNKFPEAFVGHAGLHNVRDCARMAEKEGLLFSKQKRSLSALVAFFFSLHLDKKLARSHWSALHLPHELINYAALDAWMSLLLYKRIVALKSIYRKPSTNELQAKQVVRLLASRSNVVVAFGEVQDMTAAGLHGTATTITRRRDNVLVKILATIDGSAKIPAQEGNDCVTVATAHIAGCAVLWPKHRMTLSSTIDLENASKYCTKTAIDNPPIVRLENGPIQDHHVNNTLTDSELNEELRHLGVLPDDTTLQNYPDRQAHDVSEDIDFVLLETNRNGTVCRSEGDASMFERNGVKGDPFHYVKRLFETWKRNHGFNKVARGLVRDAIMVPNPDQVNKLLPVLASHLKAQQDKKWSGDDVKSLEEAQRRLVCPSSKILKDIERFIPAPNILEHRFTSVVKFIANVKDDKTGEPLFSKESWKVYHQFLSHI